MNALLQNLLAQPRQEPIRVQSIELRNGSQMVSIQDDEFLIGHAEVCDLVIQDSTTPHFAAVIRLQDGAAWVEATEMTPSVMISGRPYRRLALRQGDQLQFGNEVWNVSLQTNRNFNTQDLPYSSLETEIRDLLHEWNAETAQTTEKTSGAFPQSMESGLRELLKTALMTHQSENTESLESLRERREELEDQSRAAQEELETRIERLLDHLQESTAALRVSA